MAGRKEYELLFKLSAALGGDFNGTFQKALNTTKQLQNTLSKLNSVSGKIDGYKRQSDALEKNRTKLSALKEEHEKLQQEMERTEQPTEALQKKFEQNEKRIAAVTTKIEDQQKKLDSLGRELKEAGVNTDNLSASNDKLKKSYEQVKKSQEQLAKISAAQEKNAAAISKTKAQLATTIGVIGAVGTAIVAGPVKSAMDFESAMADVVKVVDGLKDTKTGKLTAEYQNMKKALIDLSTKVPMTATELTKIAASAGQAGIARQEIVKFTEDAAKMGVAFDVTADQAGDWMAKWRTSFGMTQSQVVALADTVNMLSDTTASSAEEVANIVTKVGPLGEVAGLTSGQIAAMGASLVSVGIQDDVAATGIKKLAVEMAAGSSVTKRQAGVLDKLGISATGLAKRMQTDAKGAILDFLGAVSKLPKAEQTAALSDYFGTESVGAIAPLLTRLDLLKTSFDEVGNSASYAGSMEREFASRSNTAENKIKLAKNSLKNLSMAIGDTFLPNVGQAAEKLSDLVNRLADFVTKNPELIMTLTKVGAALAATAVGGQAAKLGFLKLKGGVLDAQKIFAKLKEHLATSSAEAVTGGGKLAELGKKVSGYFGGVKNSLGGVDTAVSKFNFAKNLMTKFDAGSLGEVINGKIGGITSSIISPFQKIGGKIGGKATEILSPIGKNVTGFFGKIGGAIANGPMGKIGGVFKSIGGVASSVLGPAVSGLGSVFGGLFGKVMPIIAIISLLSALFIKLNGGDLSGFMKPIQQAFQQAQPALQAMMEQLKGLGEQIMPLLMNAAQQLAPLFGQLIAGLLPVAVQLITQIVPLIAQLVTQLLPVILNVITTLAPLLTTVITAILPIIVQLLQTLLPIITQLVTQVLPIIVSVLNQLLPIVTQIIQAILPVVMALLQALMPVITVLASVISSVLGAALQAVSPILNGLITILQGLINFITGVFTGNWTQAWEGVKQIFGGVFSSLVELVKAPFRVIIGVINGVIGGLNKLKIPDWVPGLGGKKISIPLIPTFAKGTPKTPDTFIAGERGAELVTNARNRTVFTAAQSGNILNNLQGVIAAAKSVAGVSGGLPQLQMAYAGAGAGGVTAPSVAAENKQSSIIIHSEPKFYVGKDTDTGEIDAALKKHDEELMAEIEARQRKKEDDERRQRYD